MGIATKLEATPTLTMAPDTAVKAPPQEAEEIRLPPLAQAQRAYRAAATVEKKVIPASILQMNLMVARAHLANALDQYLEIDGYLLKQKGGSLRVAHRTRAVISTGRGRFDSTNGKARCCAHHGNRPGFAGALRQ